MTTSDDHLSLLKDIVLKQEGDCFEKLSSALSVKFRKSFRDFWNIKENG